jgi:hypothetical protein
MPELAPEAVFDPDEPDLQPLAERIVMDIRVDPSQLIAIAETNSTDARET